MTLNTIPGGLLVAIEGIDGAGKTTLAQGLEKSFRETGAVISRSKEPTSGPYGTQLRESASSGRLDPAEEVRLLLLDRRQHVEQLIGPALDRGEIVILDRYFPSMVAYQGAAGLDVEELLRANDFAPRPDLLIVLDLPPSTGLTRIHSRGDQPNAFEDPETLSKCREIFLAIDVPNKKVISALDPAEAVLAKVQTEVLLAIAKRAHDLHGASADAADFTGRFLPNLSVAN